jgi:ABC-type phosphate transport system substrate-binding protein
MKKYIISGVLWMILFHVSSPGILADTKPMVIITHQNVADALKKDEIKEIFLGKKTRWKDNSTIFFVVLTDDAVYPTFLKDYVGKTTFQYVNYWKQQVFTGKGRMPKSFANSKDVMQFVADTPGAISFIPEQEVDSKLVKTITVAP